jgi:hypothetical protein
LGVEFGQPWLACVVEDQDRVDHGELITRAEKKDSCSERRESKRVIKYTREPTVCHANNC